MTRYLKKILPLSFVLFATAQASWAQEPLVINDPNIGFNTTVGGGLEWQIDVSLAGDQSTIAGVHQTETAFATLQILTIKRVNPAALGSDEDVKITTKNFLEGLCKPFQCVDTTNSTHTTIGARQAWTLATELDLAQYKQVGLTDAFFVATTTPKGYMQIFSVNTEGPASDAMKTLILDAAINTTFE